MQERSADQKFTLSAIPALVIDRDRLKFIDATLRVVTSSDCCIVSDQVRILPPYVGLVIKGQQEIFNARIQWRRQRHAGARFAWDKLRQEGAELERNEWRAHEKRSEQRYAVSIPALVSKPNAKESMRCVIREASASGCRIEAKGIGRIKEDIVIRIKPLHIPINGRVVWSEDNIAGVKLLWEFASEPPDIECLGWENGPLAFL